jgi:pSer/pThr/pTyr-binding forkhead associated (FHA) protein/thioredoxin reductase/NAD-dependent dihydropyrimidine dehydrogenase PreA subunit
LIVLVFKQGPQKGKQLELDKPRVTFGRDPDSDVVLDDPRASWAHFVIERGEDGAYTVVDLGSRNGTYLGELLTPVTVPERLPPQSSLWFGDTEVEVNLLGALPKPASRVQAREATVSSDQAQMQAAFEEMRQRQAQGLGPTPNKANRGGAALDGAIWEGVRDESVVVDVGFTEEDLDSIPASFRLRARLIFLSGPHEGRQVFLGSRPTTFGRDPDQDVVLDDDMCSRLHARIVRGPKGEYALSDLGSRNGTMLNGKRIEAPRRLEHRALVTLGASVVEYRAALIDERVENPLKTSSVSLPLYSFEGKVLSQFEVVLGRDPTLDLVLEDRSVDRHHARLVWRGEQFAVRDTSERGTKVNGARVIEQLLKSGDVLQVGVYRLTLNIDGLRCNLDIVQTRPDEVEQLVNDAGARKPYKTIVRLPAISLDGGEAQQEKVGPLKFRRKEVRWKQPWETVGDWRLPLLVATAAMVGLVVVSGFALRGGGAFLSRPLTTAHDSKVFSQVADANDVAANCSACHEPLRGISEVSCGQCHERKLQDAHAEAKTKEGEPFTCTTCHSEHKPAEEVAQLLSDRCQACHLDRHERLLKVTPGPVKLDAPNMKRDGKELTVGILPGISANELHEAHAGIERRCAGCHASADLKHEVDPRTSCLRCHGPKSALDENPCATCHQMEHGDPGPWVAKAIGHKPKEEEREARVFGVGGPLESLGGGAGVMFLFFVPLGLVLGGHSLWTWKRRADERRKERDDDEGGEEGEKGGEEGGEEGEGAKADGAESRRKRRKDDWHEVWEVEIDAEKCVGAGPCIHACPYNVLVFDKDLYQAVAKYTGACHGCKACAKACPQAAITVYKAADGLPSQDFPDLTPEYEVREVPGMYLVGQVTGFKALMKNAANLGHKTVNLIVKGGVVPGSAAQAGADVEVFIAGAGPGGLAAALEAQRQGLRYVLCEKSKDIAATHTILMHKGKPLQANPATVKSISSLPMFELGFKSREQVLESWHKAAQDKGLELRFEEEVKNVQKDGEVFVVTTSKGSYRALRVILAIGSQGKARSFPKTVKGNDHAKIQFALSDPDLYDGKDILVFGAGNAGLEIAVALVEANGGSNRVGLVHNKDLESSPASAENKDKIRALAEQKRLTLYTFTAPLEVHDREVLLGKLEGKASSAPKAGGLPPICEVSAGSERAKGGGDRGERKEPEVIERFSVPNDFVFCNYGADAPRKWLESLGVKYAKKPSNWNPGPTDRQD